MPTKNRPLPVNVGVNLSLLVVFVLAENLRFNLSKLIFADNFLQPEMEDNFNELAEEDLNDNLGQQTNSEKTKKFLKKLEIQHKLLARMISPELSDSASDDEREKHGHINQPEKKAI